MNEPVESVGYRLLYALAFSSFASWYSTLELHGIFKHNVVHVVFLFFLSKWIALAISISAQLRVMLLFAQSFHSSGRIGGWLDDTKWSRAEASNTCIAMYNNVESWNGNRTDHWQQAERKDGGGTNGGQPQLIYILLYRLHCFNKHRYE